MSKKILTCYKCSAPATTKEHVPPRCFFPKGSGLNLQLTTVPSCATHNNDKSSDDQYLLAHICMNASKGPSLARDIFERSILPQIERSPKFHSTVADDSEHFADGTARYKVDLQRFDNFFDHLCWALYFDRYGTPFDESMHVISHTYFTLITDDPRELQKRAILSGFLEHFRNSYMEQISHYEAAKVSESVYANQIMDPMGNQGSVTMIHTFYGIFEVASLLSRKWA